MIINHPTQRFETGDGFFGSAACQVVQCDFCRKLSKRVGKDPGEAAEAARRDGFFPLRGKRLADPKKWSCGCTTDSHAAT